MTPEQHDEVRAAAERAARTSYGRLLAMLAAASGDIPLAEDALADAFERALTSWPRTGVPEVPDAWLMTVARNRIRDAQKSSARRLAGAGLDDVTEEVMGVSFDFDLGFGAIPDKRLELLFVCAHPAIDRAAHTPLMLQTALGFDAAQIARAFAVPPATMAQRLVRAKRRIRDAGIPFRVPDLYESPTRLAPVLEAIYGAYSIEWQGLDAQELESLAVEALELALIVAALLPREPEAHGLAALLALSSARAPARGSGGRFVPLDEQDPSLWDRRLLQLGEAHLRAAHALGRIGRFQLEAAIQSAHSARAFGREADAAAIVRLHRALVVEAPTLGARVSLAAAIARADGPAAGLASLDTIAGSAVDDFQPAWATRADLLDRLGRVSEARAAFDRAIELSVSPAIVEHLRHKRSLLG